MASRMYLLMFYYSYLDLLKSTFTITGQKLKMASGGRTMPKQNFTQNLSLSLEFEIRSCTIYYNQLALHSYNMNAEIC